MNKPKPASHITLTHSGKQEDPTVRRPSTDSAAALRQWRINLIAAAYRRARRRHLTDAEIKFGEKHE